MGLLIVVRPTGRKSAGLLSIEILLLAVPEMHPALASTARYQIHRTRVDRPMLSRPGITSTFMPVWLDYLQPEGASL
jgi:hypothetical protein